VALGLLPGVVTTSIVPGSGASPKEFPVPIPARPSAMPSSEAKHWWTTLPGILTALAALLGAVTALLVALNTAGLLNRASSADASDSAKALGSKPPEGSKPKEPPPVAELEGSKPKESPPVAELEGSKPKEPPPVPELEYDSYYNAKYGYSVVYPKTLLFPEKETPLGRVFKSLDGKITLNVMSVDNKERQTAPEAYAEMIRVYSQNTPVTTVEQRLEPGGFEIGTKNGPRLAHVKMVLNDRYYRLLTMEYDESERAVFDPVWTRISTQFAK
jgi:hypothetical protein